METIGLEAAKQVPALVVLSFIVIVFLKVMSARNKDILDNNEKIVNFCNEQSSKVMQFQKEQNEAVIKFQQELNGNMIAFQKTIFEDSKKLVNTSVSKVEAVTEKYADLSKSVHELLGRATPAIEKIIEEK